MTTLGWIGSLLFAICGAEEAWKAWKTKQCNIGYFLLTTWWLGEILTLIAIINQAPMGYLLFNYGLNLAFVSIMLYYKVKGKKYESNIS